MGKEPRTGLMETAGGEVVDQAERLDTDTIKSVRKTVTTAGTAEALSASEDIWEGIVIKALDTNQGNVYLGGSDVDNANGFPLSAGQALPFDFDDLSQVYLDADNDGEGVAILKMK